MKTALFIGRFQPLHNGHLQIIHRALKENDKIVIVIGSSQKDFSFYNCFTLKERKKMITGSVSKHIEKIKFIDIKDVYNNEKWYSLLEKKIPKIDLVYTGNNNTELIFKKRNYLVQKIERIDDISSTKIRKMIVKKDPKWKRLVPNEVRKIIEKKEIKIRLKELYKKKKVIGEKKCVPE